MIAFRGQAPVLTPTSRRRLSRCRNVVVPLVRKAFLLEAGEILPVEVLAMVYDPDAETSSYLGVFEGGVATVQSFPAGDVTFTEGAALKCYAIRKREERRAELHSEQRRQCDRAAAMLEGL